MSQHNITVEGGSAMRLKTAGKYCDRDIVVTATGGGVEIDPDKILPTTVTGDGFVHLDDVSEVPHDITIQAAVGTKITVVRNNLFDIDNFTMDSTTYTPTKQGWERVDNGIRVYDTTGTWTNKPTTVLEDIEKYKGVPLEVGSRFKVENGGYGCILLELIDAAGNSPTLAELSMTTDGENKKDITIPTDTADVKLKMRFYSSTNGSLEGREENSVTYTNVYLAKKENITHYTVGANGVVEGIKSADNLTIIADNAISVTYNKSWGKHKELVNFWENYLNITAFTHSFSYCWDRKTFKPTKDIVIKGSGERAFSAWACKDYERFDLAGHLRRLGVRLDTSQATDLLHLFYYNATIGKIPTIDVTGCTSVSNMRYIFSNAQALREIEKIIVNESSGYIGWFDNCGELHEVRFEGTIAQSGMDLHWSTKLSRASIEDIINHLSTTTSGLTVTFSATAVNNAFTTDEWTALAATRSNWTISLV